MRNIEGNAPQTVNKVLVGNKCDLSNIRQVSKQQGQQLAREYDIPFIETSARTGENVQEAFILLASDVVNRLMASCGDVDATSDVLFTRVIQTKRDTISTRSVGCC